ncbi:MAG: peptide chain release factor-like protein, partial [Proteobacteria bacterium]|nr:peptide chain release factor-like protein [Pseudomonadota bacterium]
ITPRKAGELKGRIARLRIDLRLIEEQFVKGGGKGGQKINKTASAVLLKYPPLGLIVRCQRERKRSLNRFLALRELVDEIELRISVTTQVPGSRFSGSTVENRRTQEDHGKK